jgi:hypothetical protein
MHTIICTGCRKECLVAVRYATAKHKGPHSSWRWVSGSTFQGFARDLGVYLLRSCSPCRALGYPRSCTESRTVHILSTAARTDLGPRPYCHDGSRSSLRRSSAECQLFRSLILDLMRFGRHLIHSTNHRMAIRSARRRLGRTQLATAKVNPSRAAQPPPAETSSSSTEVWLGE